METQETLPVETPRRPWAVVLAWVAVAYALLSPPVLSAMAYWALPSSLAKWMPVEGVFYQTFVNMWLRWFPAWQDAELSLYDRLVEGESYYTHGPLVPLVSLFIVLMLIRYTRVRVKPSPGWGFAVLAASLLVHLTACLARVTFASGFAMVGVLAGLVLVVWGREALRRFWFPVALLLFMVPLPDVTIASFNFHLKMWATKIGVTVVDSLGIIVVRSGNSVILEGDKTLVVANVCNGLRTLISVIGFGALYAYVCKLRGPWRLGLFAMSVPVALVSNSLRVVALILVAHFVDVKTASGWFHDLSGLLIFVLAFALMFGLERVFLGFQTRVLGRPLQVLPLFPDVRRTEQDAGQMGRLVRSLSSRAGWIAMAVLLAIAGVTHALNERIPSVWTGRTAAGALMDTLTYRSDVYTHEERKLSKIELQILETEDYLYWRYSAPRQTAVDFCVIFSADNRKGIHPPDLCLEGSGQSIVYKGEVAVSDVPGRGAVVCREIVVQKGKWSEYFLYVYKCGDTYTSSFWKQQGTIFLNGLLSRNSSGALIRLSTVVDAEGLEAARDKLKAFVREGLPLLDRALP
jgi:EpsI family protein